MKKSRLLLTLMIAGVILLFLMPAAASQARNSGEAARKKYLLQHMEDPGIQIDGIRNEYAWEKVISDTGFSWPWKEEQPPPTSFRAFYSDNFVFLFYEVTDPDIVIITGPEEKTVAGGDRVELFLAVDPELEEYYCLEIDPNGKVLDYSASFYRKFDNSWDLPGLQTSGRKTAQGYAVEAAIPIEWLRRTGISDMQKDSRIIAGIYRGEFSHKNNGKVAQSWISWQDPLVEKPDFHIPSSLGTFVIHGLKETGSAAANGPR